jgi:hypothetical protein
LARLVRSLIAAVLVLTWCEVQIPAARADASLFVTDAADSLVVAGTTLFWKTDCGGEFNPPRSRLKSIPTSGGSTQTLYQPSGCQADRVSGQNVAIDGGHAYWLTGDGHVVRLARSASAGTAPTTVSTMGVTSVDLFCCSVAVDDSFVYWSENGSIYRAPKTGGARTLYASPGGPGSALDLRIAADGSLFFTKGNSLLRIRPSGTVDIVGTGVGTYGLNSARVLYDQVPTTGDQTIVSRRLSDLGDVHTLATVARSVSVDAVAADDTNVYWHESRGTTGGPVVRRPLSSGPPVAISSYFLIWPKFLVTDGAFLFFTDTTRIFRLPTGAGVAPPPGDVWVRGMEFTQAIQTTDNRVPLVGCKRTAVRVYVRSREDARGPWSDVTATLSSPLEGHTPVNRNFITVSPGGSDRNDSRDSFTFLLSPSETAPGDRTFSVRLRPPGDRAQSDISNDVMSRTMTFGPCIGTSYGAPTVYGAVFRNRGIGMNAGPAADPAPWTDVELHRQFTENAYPMSSFQVTPLPGIGTASAGTFDNLNAERTWANGELARLPAGSLLNSLLNWGTANGYAAGLRSEEENGRTGSSVPGSTMAQEVAHSLSLWWHTFDGCGNTDPHIYPRCNASIGTETGFKTTTYTIPPLDSTPFETGIHPIPPTTSAGTTVDYMSYTFTPNWTSPFTYCTLMRALGSITCPAGVEGGGTAPRAPAVRRLAPTPKVAAGTSEFRFLYLSGLVRKNGTGTIDAVEEIRRAEDQTSYVPGSAYRLAITADAGSVTNVGFRFLDSHHDTERPLRYSVVVPLEANAAKVALFHGKTRLAIRAATPNPPTVAVVSPTGGELSGKQKVAWDGSDPDGGTLFYSVEYSPDDGKTWLPVAIRKKGTSAIVNFDALPGSPSAILRVEATDGLNTAMALSNPFSVPTKAPDVTISTPAPTTSLTPKATLVGQGFAYDYEDGSLSDMDAYEWLIDGKAVGQGPWLVVTPASLKLSKGEHELTLRATDSSLATGEAAVSFTVG